MSSKEQPRFYSVKFETKNFKKVTAIAPLKEKYLKAISELHGWFNLCCSHEPKCDLCGGATVWSVKPMPKSYTGPAVKARLVEKTFHYFYESRRDVQKINAEYEEDEDDASTIWSSDDDYVRSEGEESEGEESEGGE